MTDNFEDPEHQETTHTEETPTGPRSHLVEAWRTKPLFKLLVVMVVAGAAIAAGTALFSGSKKDQPTHLINPPDIHQPPGGPSSPYFVEQTKEAEQQRTREALEKGTSALPTPIGERNGDNINDKLDPMTELRSETEHLKQQLAQVQNQQNQGNGGKGGQAEQFDQNLSQAMQSQMKELMTSWTPKGIKNVSVTKADKENGNAANGTGGANGGAGSNAAASMPQNGQEEFKPIVEAGTVSYAQLLTEANSDVPTPILAQIVSGPLNGAKAVGTFQVANGYNDYLVLHFTHASLDGKDYHIDAIALDPDTTLGGMATEVDQRYFTRVLLPAAAGFLSGFGEALGTSNESLVTTGGLTTIVQQGNVGVDQGVYRGIGQAAQTAAQFFQNQANQTKPLVRVAANTPMGLFFVTPVCQFNMCSRNPADNTQNNQNNYPYGSWPGQGNQRAGLGLPYGSQNGGMMGYPGGAYGQGGYGQGGYGYGGLGGGYGGGYGSSGYGAGGGVPYPNYGTPNTGTGGGYGAGGFPSFPGTVSSVYGH